MPRIKCPTALWQQDRISDTLVSLPGNEGITKHAPAGPARRGIVWPTRLEVDSLDPVATYGTNGFGIGLSVAVPKARISSRIRVLKLDDCAPVVVGSLWRGKLTALTGAFPEEFRLRAQQLLT